MEKVSCRSPFKGGKIVGRKLGKQPLCLGPYTSRLAKSAPLVRLRDVYWLTFSTYYMEAAKGGRTLTSKYWQTFIPKKIGLIKKQRIKVATDIPRYVPNQLHIRTSRTHYTPSQRPENQTINYSRFLKDTLTWSHQHWKRRWVKVWSIFMIWHTSAKLGNWCCRLYSANSNAILRI